MSLSPFPLYNFTCIRLFLLACLCYERPPKTRPVVGRRSKSAAFPMTYTARATLEIGSGSVGAGRAVTTTTASNQVRTVSHAVATPSLIAQTPDLHCTRTQMKLLRALCPKGRGGGTDRSLPRGPDEPLRDKKRKKKKKVAADLPFSSPVTVVPKIVDKEHPSQSIGSKKITILKRACSDQQKQVDGRKLPNKLASSLEAVEPESKVLLSQPPLPQRPQKKNRVKKLNEATMLPLPGDASASRHKVLPKSGSSRSPQRKTPSNETVDVAGALPFSTLFPSYYNTNNPYLKSCLVNMATAHVSTTEVQNLSDQMYTSPPNVQEPKTNIAVSETSNNAKKKEAPLASVITNRAPTEIKNAKTTSKKSDELSRVPKKKTVKNTAPNPSACNPTLQNNSQSKTLDHKRKTKEDYVCSVPFQSLFPNYYNNYYLNSVSSNPNEDNVQPNRSDRNEHSPNPLHMNSLYNYQDIPQTDGPTHGPPEALFPKGTPKSKKPNQNNNNFLRQYYTNNAYKANPIICSQNNDESSSYIVEPFREGPTYSSHGRNRERNNNNVVVNKSKPVKGNSGKSKCETNPNISKPDEQNRSPVRNVRPMTIAKRVTATVTTANAGVTIKRAIDKNNDGHSKRRTGTSDNSITDNFDKCIDNTHMKTKYCETTSKLNKDNAKLKENLATSREKQSTQKEKKKLDSKEKVVDKDVQFHVTKDEIKDEKIVDKDVELHVTKDEIEDSTKTDVQGNVMKTDCKEYRTEYSQKMSNNQSEISKSNDEDDVRPIQIKQAKKQKKMLVVGDDGSIELVDMTQSTPKQRFDKHSSNLDYFTEQEKFFQSLESSEPNENFCDSNERSSNCDKVEITNVSSNDVAKTHSKPYQETDEIQVENIDTQSSALSFIDMNNGKTTGSGYTEHYIVAELSNNAYVFLTAPNSLLSNLQSTSLTQKLREITSGDAEVSKPDKKSKKKRNKSKKEDSRVENPAANLSSDKAVLRKLLFEKLLRDGVTENRLMSSGASKKVFNNPLALLVGSP